LASESATSEQIVIADIVGVYGIKGWVKIRVYLEDPATIQSLANLSVINARGAARPVTVRSIRAQGKGWIAQLSKIDDRNAAEALRGFQITVNTNDLPTAGEGEFYWRDLTGLSVYEMKTESLLGEVNYLLDTGSNDVLVIKSSEGSIDDRERLIPWLLGDVVISVDLAGGRLMVDWHIDD
jgi:16S rRNA processing protein RimM|tara:strand:- start:5321 stop:5863 length:543 start_codon:yes stop_codon:yes gene_type:complete